jgi:hypothetical protein
MAQLAAFVKQDTHFQTQNSRPVTNRPCRLGSLCPAVDLLLWRRGRLILSVTELVSGYCDKSIKTRHCRSQAPGGRSLQLSECGGSFDSS